MKINAECQVFVTGTGIIVNITGFWCGNMKERDNMVHLNVDRRIILK